MDISHNIPVQALNSSWYGNKVSSIDMLRLDKVHPIVSGNKWFKLKYNIQACRDAGYDTILTFGGAYSNHLAATAYATQQEGIKSIGIIRGEELKGKPSPTLKHCIDCGMQLHYVSREQYKNRHASKWQQELSEQHKAFVVPEGGANKRGIDGAADIVNHIPNIDQYTHIIISAGTGTTLAGVRNATPKSIKVVGFAPMKGGAYLNDEIDVARDLPFVIYDNWHMGGFGKHNEELIDFMNDFYNQNVIPLDIVYTAKMMFGVHEMLQQNAFADTDKLLCIHTGGLQGNSSVAYLLHY